MRGIYNPVPGAWNKWISTEGYSRKEERELYAKLVAQAAEVEANKQAAVEAKSIIELAEVQYRIESLKEQAGLPQGAPIDPREDLEVEGVAFDGTKPLRLTADQRKLLRELEDRRLELVWKQVGVFPDGKLKGRKVWFDGRHYTITQGDDQPWRSVAKFVYNPLEVGTRT